MGEFWRPQLAVLRAKSFVALCSGIALARAEGKPLAVSARDQTEVCCMQEDFYFPTVPSLWFSGEFLLT